MCSFLLRGDITRSGFYMSANRLLSGSKRFMTGFGEMRDHDPEQKKFGEILFGVEKIKRDIAKIADQNYQDFTLVLKFKENFKFPVLLSGSGTGKSSMLDRHLEALREHCTNVGLKALLDRAPLVLSIAFSGTADFSPAEHSDLPQLILARRILAAYWDLRFKSCTIPRLPSVPYVLSETLKLIVEHHKAEHGLNATDQIAILINVDDLNEIPSIMDKQEEDKPLDVLSASEIMVRGIAIAIRDLSMDGISGSPVIPLYAGNARRNVVRALQGVEVKHLDMPLLTSELILDALRNCGVSEQYLKNADFLRLLDESGGIPIVIREMVEQLTVKYDPSCIPLARAAASEYLNVKSSAMSTEDCLGLIPTVVLGERVTLAQRISGSMETYDSLQRVGIVWLVPDKWNKFLVTMPLLSLQSKMTYHDTMSRKVRKLLDILDSRDRGKFKLFCAGFSALKMYHLSRTLQSVTMSYFYGDVDMSPEVAKLEIQLSAAKDYCAKSTGAALTEAAAAGFRRVGTMVSEKGAAADCMMIDPLFERPGEMLVRALRISLPDDDGLELSEVKFLADRDRALLALEAYSSVSPNAKGITVHITHRPVSKDIVVCSKDCTACTEKKCIENSVVVGQHNLAAFFGPVLVRGMWSKFNTHLI